MKYIFTVIVLLAVVGSYFAFRDDTTDSVDTSHPTVTGVASAVDLDQVAFDGPYVVTITDADGNEHVIEVPSMGIQLCAAADRIASVGDIEVGDTVHVHGIINETGAIVPCESDDHFLIVTGTYTDETSGYQFNYTKSPDGYVLVDTTGGISLFDRAEYEAFIASASLDAREGPPALGVAVYANDENQSAAVWSTENSDLTNEGLAIGAPEEAVVGGANAVYFVADGLWPLHTYVVAHDSKMYVLTAMIPDGRDALLQDFMALVDTFTFVQTPDQL